MVNDYWQKIKNWNEQNKTWFWGSIGGVIITLIVTVAITIYSNSSGKQNPPSNIKNNINNTGRNNKTFNNLNVTKGNIIIFTNNESKKKTTIVEDIPHEKYPMLAKELGDTECKNKQYSVNLFKYHGSEANELYTGFNQFRGILKDKIITMVEEILSSNPNCDYLAHLNLCFINDYLPDSYDQIIDFWNRNSIIQPLELLSGAMFLEESSIIVQSRAHVNTDQSNNEKIEIKSIKSFNIKMEIKPEEFGSIRDSHSVLILYALAMDAKRKNLPTNIISEYLSKAYSLSKDLQIKKISKLLEKELEELKMSFNG